MHQNCFPHLDLPHGDAKHFAHGLSRFLPSEITAHGRLFQAATAELARLDGLASPETCAKRAERFQVSPQLAAERILERHGEQVVIAGLRFRKLDSQFPFVHLTASYPLAEADIERLLPRITEAFSPLSLRGITVRQGPHDFSQIRHDRWAQTVFGRTADVPKPILEGSLKFKESRTVEFFPTYYEAYQRFFVEAPQLAAVLWIEEEKDLQDAAERDLLLSVHAASGWAGLIAGQERELYGLPCLYIFELFLAEQLRGRGIAKQLEAQFLKRLASRFPYVFGHIHNSNLASLNTAQSLGRNIVETEYFFPIQV